MKIKSLQALATRFHSMAEGLDVEPYFKLFHTTPQHDGSPHVEIKAGKFDLVVTERGGELHRVSGLSEEDVLYLLFLSITQHMATSYELHNRKPVGDGRAVWFPYQEALMANLDPSWGPRTKAEHEKILTKYPFQS